MLYPGRGGDHFWLPVEKVVKSHPEWVCELIAAYLDRLLLVVGVSGGGEDFPLEFGRESTGEQVIADAANSAPSEFRGIVAPPCDQPDGYLRGSQPQSPVARQSVGTWALSTAKDGLDNRLLAGLEFSLCWTALNVPDQFRVYANSLKGSKFVTAQNLLLRSYAAAGKLFADEAIGYILEDPKQRFSIGYVSTSSDHAAEQLLGAASTFCSSENFSSLERAILNFYPERERSADGRRWFGLSQLRLLMNLDSCRLSERGLRRLQELQRKFEDPGFMEPRDVESGWVASPIPESSASKMSDDDWLGAIRHYSSDSPSDEPAKFLVGGAHELSQLLEAQTNGDPSRFAKLVHRIPDSSNTSYFEAILKGLDGADINMEAVVETCLRCHQIPGRPLGRSVTRPLVHFSGSQLPDKALHMVAWYATEHPNPDPETVSSETTYYLGGREYQRYDPIMAGINSVRGSAAGTIARLLFQDEYYLSFFEPHLRSMVRDPSDATRACVAEALLGVLRHNRDLAVELFLELCDADERLLATRLFEDFLRYAIPTHFTELEPVLDRMVKSSDEAVATAGARWACYASLTVEEALPLASQCPSGSKSQRLGAAEVYAANLRLSAYRSVSEEMLGKLFFDPEMEVRHKAARCFYGFEGRELGDYTSLVVEFIQSPAFEPEHNPLFDALEKTTAHIPEVVLMACDRVFELAAEKTGDLSTAVAGTSSTIAKLIVRVYSRTTDPSVRSRCLDIIDKMSLFGAYGLDVITEEFDR